MRLSSEGLAIGIKPSATDIEEFSAPLVLARILEGREQPGFLAQSLGPRTTCRDVACYVSTLGEAFNSLPTTQQDQIRHRWGSHFSEILSLSRETDAELFYEALFHLGQRLEREGHQEQAGLVYSALLGVPNGTDQGTRRQGQAQERIAVLQGGGSLGNQMEHMGRGFARSALDPGLLLGASSMGLFGKGVELIGMRYLAGANFFRRSYGIARTALELAPKATGFALEATAFPYAINGANELLGRPVSWAHMDHRILGSWFFLGGMRVGGRLGASASRRLGVEGLQTVGSIAGVGLGHGGEVLAGLKDWHGFSNFAVETFGTWANLQVAGRFSEYVFDGQIQQMQRVMDASIESNRRTGASAPRRFQDWVDSLSENFNNFGGPKPLAIGTGGGSASIDSPRRRLAEAPRRFDGSHHMASLSDPPGPRGPTMLSPRMYENGFRKGTVLVDMETRRDLLSEESFKILRSTEDRFSDMILGVQSKGKRFSGPIATLIKSSGELRDTFVRHLDKPEHRLWVKFEEETGILQHIAALDAQGRARVLLIPGLPLLDRCGKILDYVLRLELGFSTAELGFVRGKRYELDQKEGVIIQEIPLSDATYNGLSVNEAYEARTLKSLLKKPTLEIRLGRDSPQEVIWELQRTPLPAWRIRDSNRILLFHLEPPAAKGRNFPWNPLALPEPTTPVSPLPAKPFALKTTKSKTPTPAPVAQSIIKKVSKADSRRPQKIKTPPSPKLEPKPPKTEEKKKAITQPPFDPNVILLRLEKLTDREENTYPMRIIEMEENAREDFILKLADYLAHESPRVRANTFLIFREIIHRLSSGNLQSLQEKLNQDYPKASGSDMRTIMVHQVKMLIREQFRTKPGRI